MFSKCCEPAKCRSVGYCRCNSKSGDAFNVEGLDTSHVQSYSQSYATSVPDQTYSQSNGQETNAQFVDSPPSNARILKPLVQERIVEVLKPEIEEKIIEVPQVKYVEKIVEVPQIILQEKLIHVPKPVIHERIKKCPKPVYQEKIVEVPQIKVVDKIVEVPQYVYQEKIIEVPKVMVQERIIPVPKRVVREKIVEIPQIELKNVNVEKTIEEPEYVPEYVKKDVPYTQVVDRPYHVEKIVEVPHVQHIYRNIVSPQYRHIPKPVEVPMAHYRTFPVEKLVDRNVPVPVEIQIVQEFLCPKIEARYKEIPVPVHVQRIIEHPIPKDAMNNPHLLPLYYQEDVINAPNEQQQPGPNNQNKNTPKSCFTFNCGKGVSAPSQEFHNKTRISSLNNNQGVPVELLLQKDKERADGSRLPFTRTNPMMNSYTNVNNVHMNANPGSLNRHSFTSDLNRGGVMPNQMTHSQMSMHYDQASNMVNNATQLQYQQMQQQMQQQQQQHPQAVFTHSMQNASYENYNNTGNINLNTNGKFNLGKNVQYTNNGDNKAYNSIPRSIINEAENN